jgi:hypothetical protein
LKKIEKEERERESERERALLFTVLLSGAFVEIDLASASGSCAVHSDTTRG